MDAELAAQMADGGGEASEHMSQALREALRMPSESREVSDFLFDNLLDTTFHKDRTLGMDALDTALSMRLQETVEATADANERLPQAWKVRAEGCVRAIMHILYVPIDTFDAVAVGYALVMDIGENALAMRNTPFETPCIARFAADKRTADLLLVSIGGVPPCIGLHAVSHRAGGFNAHVAIAVPAAPYQWPYLPTTVLWMLSTGAVRRRDGEDDDANLNVDDLSAAALVATARQQPPTTPPSTAGTRGGSRFSGALTSDANADANCDAVAGTGTGTGTGIATCGVQPVLLALERELRGSFDALCFRFDALVPAAGATNGNAGALFRPLTTSAVLGRGHLRFMATDAKDFVRLRERFASVYYLAALAPSSVGALVMPQGAARSPRLTDARARAPARAGGSPAVFEEEEQQHHHHAGGVGALGAPGASGALDDDAFWLHMAPDALRVDAASVEHGGARRDADASNEPCDAGAWPAHVLADRSSPSTPDALTAAASTSAWSTSAWAPLPSPPQSPPPSPLPLPSPSPSHSPSTSQTPMIQGLVPLAPRPDAGARVDGLTCASAPALPRPPSPTCAAVSERLPPHPVALVPAPAPPPSCRRGGDADVRRLLLEERRRRNRISAARSNERRSRFIAQLKRDTEDSKRKVAQLVARKAIAQSENQRLRQQLLSKFALLS